MEQVEDVEQKAEKFIDIDQELSSQESIRSGTIEDVELLSVDEIPNKYKKTIASIETKYDDVYTLSDDPTEHTECVDSLLEKGVVRFTVNGQNVYLNVEDVEEFKEEYGFDGISDTFGSEICTKPLDSGEELYAPFFPSRHTTVERDELVAEAHKLGGYFERGEYGYKPTEEYHNFKVIAGMTVGGIAMLFTLFFSIMLPLPFSSWAIILISFISVLSILRFPFGPKVIRVWDELQDL